ncbi:MAG: hypothetical protein NWE89_17435 [Candidatus Bathyarchaeota archaeon]|nr:hypothetical protein [Candidatus Bathyarchaeota archaeon]
MAQKIQAKSLEQLFQEAFGEGNLALAVRDIYGTWTEYPFAKGNLTTDGVQWSAVVGGSSVSSGYVVVSTATINPSNLSSASIQEVKFNLVSQLETTYSTGVITFKWEAKDADNSTWTIISTERALTLATTFAGSTMSGYFLPVANFNSLPFHLRLRMKVDSASKGLGKVKNTSYVTVKYKPPAV